MKKLFADARWLAAEGTPNQGILYADYDWQRWSSSGWIQLPFGDRNSCGSAQLKTIWLTL
jgi:hypothetical protein